MIEDKKEIEIVRNLLKDNFTSTSMGNPKICYDFALGILTSCYKKTKSQIVNNVLIKLKESSKSSPCSYFFDYQLHQMFLDELCLNCLKNESSASRYILINLSLYGSNTMFGLFNEYVNDYYDKNNINYGYDTNLDEVYNKRFYRNSEFRNAIKQLLKSGKIKKSKIKAFGRSTLEFTLAEGEIL
jgi:hypothetical protein